MSHRSSFFLIGFYTFALSCLALILKFGVLEAVNPPSDKLVGVFVLACCIAGVVGGGVAIFFWQQAKYFIGAWGGFAVGLWIQCLRNGGLIRPIGMRWILYIGTSRSIFDMLKSFFQRTHSHANYRPGCGRILSLHTSKDSLPRATRVYRSCGRDCVCPRD